MPAIRRVLRRMAGHWGATAAAILLLFGLNLAVAWRYIGLDFSTHFFSIEGVFIGMAKNHVARLAGTHWVGLWLLGIPVEHIYVPGLHVLVDAVQRWTDLTPARAYHRTTGVLYCLIPPSFYLSLVILRQKRQVAMLAALLATFLSPAMLFSAGIREDLGGSFSGQRLLVLAVYGEGPHMSALVLTPLLVAFLLRAREEQQPLGRNRLAAIFLFVLLIATNTPATMGFAVFAVAILTTCTSRGRTVLTLGAGLAISLYLVPATYWSTIFSSAVRMHPESLPAGASLLLKAGLAGVLLVAMRGISRIENQAARVYLAAGVAFTALILTAKPLTFELLPQAQRLHVELELCVCFLAAIGLSKLHGWMPAWGKRVGTGVLALLFGAAFVDQDKRMARDLRPAKVTERVEYQAAEWANQHLRAEDGRVFTSGSTALWFSAFSSLPIVEGCCEQGVRNDMGTRLRYIVNLAETETDLHRAVDWATALGVRTLILPAEQSNDAYHSTKRPEKFQRLLRREDTNENLYVYRLPGCETAYVHLVPRAAIVPVGSNRETALISPLISQYARAVNTCAEDRLRTRWTSDGEVHIQAAVRGGEVVSLQVNHLAGWTVRGLPAGRIEPDGLGLLVIDPGCAGDCQVSFSLIWQGQPGTLWSQYTGMASAGLLCVFAWRTRSGARSQATHKSTAKGASA